MAWTYEEVVRRLGRRTSVQIDKRRGTELRIARGEAGVAGDLEVRYRGTPVVTFHSDHTYTLRTGGTASKTVIRRIAEYSPVSLVRRGNGFYLEDVARGQLIPFLEGTRVDAAGRVLGSDMQLPSAAHVESSHRGEAGTAAGTQAGSTDVRGMDAATFRAYVREIVREILTERPAAVGTLAPSRERAKAVPATAAPTAAAAAAAAPADGADVHVRIVAEPVASKAKGGTDASIPVHEVIRILGLPPEKQARELRNLQAAFLRGRVHRQRKAHAAGVDEDEPRGTAALPGAKCGTCGQPMAQHYDGANRFRGCDYALRHIGA